MTEKTPPQTVKRAPQVFEPTDPALVVEPVEPAAKGAAQMAGAGAEQDAIAQAGASDAPSADRARPGLRLGWMSLLLASLTGLVGLASSLAFAHFVSTVLERSDWIGITGWVLVGIAVLAATVLALREIVGLMRLARLAQMRREADAALRARDHVAERQIVRRLRHGLASRPDLAWAAARFAEHENDVRDPGDLLALADRELIAPIDLAARRVVLAASKRVSLVTALSPIAVLAVVFVLFENLRMLRALATLYGGKPGMLGGLRLARMVFVHILATGGLALTDDLIGQFIGQDLARRLSRRLGEGLFNGALTARIGVAALDVCRPLPFIEARPVRLRDILSELTRRAPKDTTGT